MRRWAAAARDYVLNMRIRDTSRKEGRAKVNDNTLG